MQKKIHPEQYDLAALVNQASEFTAYYRNGPQEKYTLRGFTNYDDARAAADKLEQEHSRFGRRALVYAIAPRNISVPCDGELMALAQEIAAK